MFSPLMLPCRALPRWVSLLSAMTLPVYCVHMLIIETLLAVVHKLHFGKSMALDLTMLLVAVVGSCFFAWWLQRATRPMWLTTLHR